MLQITTGRFWGERKRYDSLGEVKIFSNASLDQSFVLSSGEVHLLVDNDEAVAKFIYLDGMPIPESGNIAGTIVAAGGSEIESQFVAFLTVFSDHFWDTKKDVCNLQKNLCFSNRSSCPQLFDEHVIDAQKMSYFFEHLLSLPRSNYQAIAEAAQALHLAISLAHLSYDAAFVITVFALESLVPNDSNVEWSDFPERTRLKLDSVLGGSGELERQIRTILLDDGNFKLQARFIKFINEHLKTDYFRSCKGIRQSQLHRLLVNLYSGRSRFVHALEAIKKPLDVWEIEENFIVTEDGPHFTLQGLLFLAFAVIKQIVELGPHLSSEENVPWSNQIPGIIQYPLAPQYWLWDPNNFQAENLHERFSDILSHLLSYRLDLTQNLVDLRPPINKLISQIDRLSKDGKLYVICILIMWSDVTEKSLPVPNTDRIIEKYNILLNNPSLQSLILHVFRDIDIPWSVDDSSKIWRNYQKKRYQSKSVKIPFVLESCIRARISNRYLEEGNINEFVQYCNDIANDEGKRPYVISHVENVIKYKIPLDLSIILKGE